MRAVHRTLPRGTALWLSVAGVLCRPATVEAQAFEAAYQTWTSMTIQALVHPDLQIYFDANLRLYDDFHPYQVLLRPGLGARIGDGMWITLAYAWTPSWNAEREFVDEHRIWEQWTWDPSGLPGRMRLFVRTRFEQRFRPALSSDVALRVRQFVRLLVPYTPDSPLHLSLWDEAFVALTDSGDATGRLWQRLGFDQNRLFLGVGWNASDGVRIEIGYLNHWIVRPGTDDVHHALMVNGFVTIR
jgi:hypothetical protein